MIMQIKGIAAAAYSGTTKSSARIPTLLLHLLIAPRQQLTDTLHLFTGIIGLLFVISAQHFNVDSRHARRSMPTLLMALRAARQEHDRPASSQDGLRHINGSGLELCAAAADAAAAGHKTTQRRRRPPVRRRTALLWATASACCG